MTETFTPLEHLDNLLYCLRDTPQFMFPEYITKQLIATNKLDKTKDFNETLSFVGAVLRKLINDGYVEPIELGKMGRAMYSRDIRYAISFDGLVLLEKGGYVQLVSDENKSRMRAERNETRLTNWTIAASVVAFLLLFVEVIRLNYDYPDVFPFFWCD